MEKRQKQRRELLSFPALIGIFVYFSALIVAMAIYWQTGIWYQNPGLTNIGTGFLFLLVASAVAVSAILITRNRRMPLRSASRT